VRALAAGSARTGSPASRGHLRIRFSLFDTIWALGSPVIALALREAPIVSIDGSVYILISLAFSLVAYSAFRLHDGVSRFFSVPEAWNVVRAVACAELMTCILLFTLTRLDNIPRSTVLIHALILCAGLIAIRASARLRETDSGSDLRQAHDGVEHVIMIGSTKLTFLFVKFLAAYCPGQRRVIGVLDGSAGMAGRTVSGIRIVGPPHQLQPIIDEFAEHGIGTDRVVVGGDEDLLPEETLKEVQRVCAQRQIPLDFVPKLVGLTELETRAKPKTKTTIDVTPSVVLSPYFKWKYAVDFVGAATLLVLYAPILIIAGGLALVDVGWPMVFWQQRLGAGGRSFVIYKLRTLRPPFDQLGRPIPENKRLSWVGTLLRRTRLDELPQLFNVLVGDMSLIGPRPLLPRDQPANPSVRLMIRPGISGWAQVNGGTLLTASEKDALDEWYVQNASFWFDLRVIMMTLRVMVWGQCRPHAEMAARQCMRITNEPPAPAAPQSIGEPVLGASPDLLVLRSLSRNAETISGEAGELVVR
jgi:lipopolysaccharide/colanic/teichoic acid biosynthesis glycosyltransferase